ncbi:hypothetical protein CK203_101083 [Vitis vinifera]|uniref:Retrotransposon gag domain-containing protein n=1 Tax=Vitis vinifera TaxID=29760 RepID=A0A438CFC6_VITVI|nr:hypothetical protein CK203_101083 [Vitis vinifera]
MCGGDDHLAWKCPVSSEACRGLRTVGGAPSYTWVHLSTFRASIVIAWISILFLLSPVESAQRSDRTFVLHLDIPSWDRIEEETFRIGFYSQSGYSFVDKSRGQISLGFREDRYGSAGPVIDDAHARLDRIQQRIRQLRVSDGFAVWDDLEGMLVASLPVKFRMPDIERYTGIGCPHIHLRLYNTVMRAHGLDEPQMITLFPLSLSGAAQRWFASLESSRHRTWDDLAQEFLRQFSFNTVVDVSRRELEALR